MPQDDAEKFARALLDVNDGRMPKESQQQPTPKTARDKSTENGLVRE